MVRVLQVENPCLNVIIATADEINTLASFKRCVFSDFCYVILMWGFLLKIKERFGISNWNLYQGRKVTDRLDIRADCNFSFYVLLILNPFFARKNEYCSLLMKT